MYRNLFYILFTSFTAMVLTGCKSKTVHVPVEIVKTEYRDRISRDSVRLYDSIFIREANDTVRIERYKVIYRDKVRCDSIHILDSIQVPYPVIEYREVNKVSGWQNFQIWMGRFLLLFFSLSIIYVICNIKKN